MVVADRPQRLPSGEDRKTLRPPDIGREGAPARDDDHPARAVPRGRQAVTEPVLVQGPTTQLQHLALAPPGGRTAERGDGDTTGDQPPHGLTGPGQHFQDGLLQLCQIPSGADDADVSFAMPGQRAVRPGVGEGLIKQLAELGVVHAAQ
ncbi:hypothetical protein SAZ11_39805 [Streptomyces sp. FXJ1.4098]|nr:hypothetical protein [Streptomyces sp. FXJ1.4098]